MAFEDGLRLGADMYQKSLDNTRQAELDAQNNERFGWARQDRARAQLLQRQQDEAFDAIPDTQIGTGLPMPGTGAGQAAGDAQYPATADAVPADPRMTNAVAYRRVAKASRDVKGMQDLDAQIRALEWERDRGHSYRQFDAMTDDQLRAAIDKASNDTNARGHGTWVGEGKNAYMYYMAPGAEPVKLTRAEAREVFAAKALEGKYGDLARAHVASVSDKAAATLAAMAKEQRENANVNNTAAHFRETGAETNRHNTAQEGIERDRLGIERSKLSIMRQGMPQPLSEEAKRDLDTISARLQAVKDPNERAALHDAFNTRLLREQLQGRGAHLQMLSNGPKFEMPKEADIAGVVSSLQSDKTNKGLPYAALRQKAIDLMTGQGGGLANPYAAPAGAAGPGSRPGAPAPSAPVNLETLPLEALRGLPSREARAIYDRRAAEAERLANTPGFWKQANQVQPPPEDLRGLDQGY